ncbi:MAG: serine/threonine protein kinase, partial [Gammaproteobacteria bacterium]|nr:serine/threonine protein kinase [Gammaproteobacteria bacterium]
GRRAFFQEAAVLAALDHPNIVKVIHFFQANETVYFVMNYEQGVTLRSIIKKARQPLLEGFLRRIFEPILSGLAEVHHRQLLHLDIKPSNIYIRDDGRPLLIDFGAVYNLLSGPRNPASNVVSQGFSPKEQVYAGMEIGTWTDIYALGATLRASIEGKSPPPVKNRLKKDPLIPLAELYVDQYTPAFLRAIDAAMRVDPELRPQTITVFRSLLFD